MPNTPRDRRIIATWLLCCCALVIAMILLGGVTRLTGSGLSMVDWQPIMGVIPPLNQQEWQETFDRYREFPEYNKKYIGMDLAGFKSIFWFEYSHRVLGRGIGLAFLLPLLVFWWRGMITRRLAPRLVLMFFLGGLQGLLGWYMVKSGLVHEPNVSQYRLAAHLAAAFLIYAYMLWVALGLLFPEPAPARPRLRRYGLALTALAAVTVVSGAFVAGLKAGYAYNTFPLMDGQLVPQAWSALQPLWLNPLENIAAVQFNHRALAILTLLAVIALRVYALGREPDWRVRTGLNALLIVVLVQVALGISTLLYHVPLSLASMHQGGAIALFTLCLWLNHALRQDSA